MQGELNAIFSANQPNATTAHDAKRGEGRVCRVWFDGWLVHIPQCIAQFIFCGAFYIMLFVPSSSYSVVTEGFVTDRFVFVLH